ncbi:uncharacterized protein LOC132718166 [Ruditapes philippinarum]|uniref:uncharacterized protein LOC132718166 n=1 Tax=Ruditapes philippinarum TaxID=129788 RepID=UPI00295AD860|nr:uncharacterized protein LOC132718166 [Ruditapes philippinarum]
MEAKIMIYFLVGIICYCTQLAKSAIPEYFVEEHCSQTLALNHGNAESVRLRLTKSSKYLDGMRCAMRIQAPEGKRLVIHIENLDIDGKQEVLCQGGDYIQFFDGPSESSIIHPDLPATVCTKPKKKYILTSGRFFVMRFVSNTDLISGSGMKLVITAFSDAPCTQDEFQCKSSSHCIRRSLQCDQHPSCPDGTDESMPECLSTGAIVGISVACVAVVVAVVVTIVVVCIVRERRKRARIIKRAIQHQGSQSTYSGSLAGSLWIQSQHQEVQPSESNPIWDGQIDPSKIDPIWDGHEDQSKIEPEVNVNSDSDKILPNSEATKSPKHAPIWISNSTLWENLHNELRNIKAYDVHNTDNDIDTSVKSSVEVNGTNQVQGQMKKVPSGFWDIDLSELGIDISPPSSPSSTVL